MSVSKVKTALTNMDILTGLAYEHLTLDSNRALLQACKDRYIDEETANEIERARSSLHKLFKPIVDDTDKFLNIMIHNNIALVGHRALQFMYPQFGASDSSWDFFAFDSDELASLLCNVPDAKVISRQSYNISIELHLVILVNVYHITRKGQEYTIRILRPEDDELSVLNYVLSLPCTADQCFLTGYAAVSLYDSLTSRGLIIDWITSNEIRYNRYIHQRIDVCDKHEILHSHLTDIRIVCNSIPQLRASFNDHKIKYLTLMSRTPVNSRHKRRDNIKKQIIDSLTGNKSTNNETVYKIADLICTDCSCISNDEVENGVVESIKYYTDRGFKITNPRDIIDSDRLPIEVKQLFTRLDTSMLSMEAPDIFIASRSIQSGGTSLVVDLTRSISDDLLNVALHRLERLFSMSWNEIVVMPNDSCVEVSSPDSEIYTKVNIYRDIYGEGLRRIEPIWSPVKCYSLYDMIELSFKHILDEYDLSALLHCVSRSYGKMSIPFGI